MGAAHSASEEVRELVGKTGCKYSTGDAHGGSGGDCWPAGAGATSPLPPTGLLVLCDLGLVAGPLCASVSPSFKWVPAYHFAGCGGEPAAAQPRRSRSWLGTPRLRTADPGGSRARASPGQAPGPGEPAPGDAQLVRALHLKVVRVHDA